MTDSLPETTVRAHLVAIKGDATQLTEEYAKELKERPEFVWLDVTRVRMRDLISFARYLGLTEDNVQHLGEHAQRASFTASRDGVRWTMFGANEAHRIVQVRGVYTKEILITFHDVHCDGLDEAIHRYSRMVASHSQDGPLLLFMVLDALATTFESPVAILDGRLDELEASTLEGVLNPGYVKQVLEIRQILTPIVRSLGPYRRDLVSLLGTIDRLPGMNKDAEDLFESHRNHVVALVESIYDCRDETRDAMQAFSSANSERQGEVINWLTIIAAIFLPLTFITGYFGMNFSVITHLKGTLPYLLLGVILPCLLGLGTLFLVRFLVRRLGVPLIPSRRLEFSSHTRAADHGQHGGPPTA